MDIPKEIIVVPLKEKIPLIKNKKRALQISGACVSMAAFLIYLYYFPAPSEFSFKNAVPIGIMIFLTFLSSLLLAYIFLPFKKSLLVAAIITSSLMVNKSRIITIITYAICIPLLFLKSSRFQNHNRE